MECLEVHPLTAAAFEPFGCVLQTAGANSFEINEGTTIRYHALARAETDPDGQAIISIFRALRRTHPIEISMLERHPLGSQAFMPLSSHDWLVVVADGPSAQALKCFRATGHQGVQYRRNVWHHPLLVLAERQDFSWWIAMGRATILRRLSSIGQYKSCHQPSLDSGAFGGA